MKLLKPSWVNHDGKAIYSVDIHPDGKRFATGGQGGDSGRVVVWNLNPVLFEAVELDSNVPKMLCHMDNHLACVNSVRWSNSGRYLASGGDDRLVMVWGLNSAAAATGGKYKSETWRCLSTLRGHAGDVLDLAWSPLDKWLASASVDNTIIIWNAEKFPEMVCVLNGHTGLVKGVAWDPVGKFLASQSDDKSLRVWKTADWGTETIITEPFEECGGTTHVLRLSWSPDGQYVVSAHAMNGGGPTAQIVERDGWRRDKDFVGHRKAVTCARFNSNILKKEGKKYCCAAVGSRDRTLSIWLTSLKRPLVVIHQLFDDSVLDISWSSDGLNLLACSSDGTVACVQFTNKEIGIPLTIEEKNAFYEKFYGKCLTSDSGGELSALLVECPDILLARETAHSKKDTEMMVDTTPKSERSQSAAPRPVDRQIETRTSDGKRRITPVFIPQDQHTHNESFGSGTSVDNCFSSSSQSKSRIRVERRDDIVIHPNVSNHATPPAELVTGIDNRLRKRTSASLPGPRADELQNKRGRDAGAGAGGGAGPGAGGGGLPVPVLGTAGPIVRAAGAYRIQVINKAQTTPYGILSKIQLLPNNSASNEPVWENYLGGAVSCISASSRWLCAACGLELHTWSLPAPTRQLPPVSLSSPAVKLSLNGSQLAVVTSSAELQVFDLSQASCVLPPLSFYSLLTPGATVTNCSILEDGNPMISLSSGKTFIYSKKLCSWVCWSDSGDVVRRAGGAGGGAGGRHRQHVTPVSAVAGRSWLQAQVSRARALLRARDHTHHTLALFTHTAAHGTEEELRSMLDDMLGPSHCTSTPKKWQPTILGVKKHDILKEMLSILVRQLRWQRLYIEYNDQLDEIKQTALLNGH